MIINELKSSYILGEGPDWESKLFVAGNNMLVPEELREIIEQLLSEQPKINSKQIARFFRQRTQIDQTAVVFYRSVAEVVERNTISRVCVPLIIALLFSCPCVLQAFLLK